MKPLTTPTPATIHHIEPSAPAPSSPYMTIPELALYLRHSPHTIRAWHKHRKLPAAFQLSGKLLWHRDEIDAWVRTTRRRPPDLKAVRVQLAQVPLPGGRR